MDCISNDFECSYLSVIIIDPHHTGEADLGLPSHPAPPRPAQLISASEDKNIGRSQPLVSSVCMLCYYVVCVSQTHSLSPLDIVFCG